MAYMNAYLKAVLVLITTLVFGAQVAQAQLHDSVPYQGDTLLVNPLPGSLYDTDQAYLDCDWNTLMSMIRDLEERIAGALEVDTVYDVYVSGQVVDNRIYMNYDCVILRDSVLSLQIQLDEALLGPPTVLSQQVMNIAQRTASIKAKVTDDGGAAMRIWGVVYGKQDWWNDSLGFFEIDSLFPSNVDYATMSDSLLADRLTAQKTAMDSWTLSSDLPIPTAMDTSILNVDSIFTRSISGLERYTNYIAVPVAANDSLMMDFNPEGGSISVDGTELNAYILGLYGMGDTLMFQTLADTASGFTLDTASVTSSAARLITSIADAGGQGPDAVQFQYDTSDFTASTFSGDSISSDSTGGTDHSAVITGLSRYTDYYFRAFADNAQGRGNSESSMTFKTLPELPTFDTLYYNAGQDTLVSILSDNGGQSPTAQGLSYWNYASSTSIIVTESSTSATNLTASHRNDTITAFLQESSLLSGERYYARASATNNAGVSQSDTVLIETRPEVTTLAANLGDSIQDIRTSIRFEGSSFYRSAIPSAFGFVHGDSLLTTAVDTAATTRADSTFFTHATNLNSGTKYWAAAYATNLGGTTHGDTLYAGATAVGTTTDTATVVSNERLILMATGDYTDALPDSLGFIWSTNADLSDADTVAVSLPSAGTYTWKDTLTGLSGGDEIFYTSFAQNERGMTFGDTLSSVTKAKVETLPLLAATDTTATFGGRLLEFIELAGHPDSIGFQWSLTDGNMTDALDSAIVFDLNSMAADSTYTLQLPFTYGEYVWYRFFAINGGGVQYGETSAFCSGACPESLDYLGETYPVVRIGCTCYFAENLRAKQYLSGDSIVVLPMHNAADKEVYLTYETAFVAEDTTDIPELGLFYSDKLVYNTQQLVSSRICPAGWDVMNFDSLVSELDPILVFDEGDQFPGTAGNGDEITSTESQKAIVRRLKSSPTDEPSWDGTNLYGFNAIQTGYYNDEGNRSANVSEFGTAYTYLYGGIGNGYARLKSETTTNTSTLDWSSSDAYTLAARPIRCQSIGIETPPTVISIPASETTPNSARLNGLLAHPGWKTTSQPAVVTDRGFMIASNPDFVDASFISIGLSGSDSMVLDLTDLVTDQQYWFVPYAMNQYTDTILNAAFGDVLSFVANTPDVPTVQTLPIEDVALQRFGKIKAEFKGVLRQKNNSEITSAGWYWYRTNNEVEAYDTIQNPMQHLQVENLVLSLDTVFEFEDRDKDVYIFEKDLKPGAQYSYYVSATNEMGTGYGDTLTVFSPMLIQPWSTNTTDSSVTIDGQMVWIDGNVDTLSIVLQVDSLSSIDDADDLNPEHAYLRQEVLETAFDTIPVILNADSTFTVTIDLPQYQAGDIINYQFFATNTLAQADSLLADTSFSQVNFFALGECPSVDYDGYTYETQRINGRCWFTSNLRAVTYTNGDSIPFGGSDGALLAGVLDSLNANYTDGLGYYFYEDSAYANDYGLLYSRSVLSNEAYNERKVCPVGTYQPKGSEARQLYYYGNWAHVEEGYVDYPWNDYSVAAYMGPHYLDEALGGTNTSRLGLNGKWFENGTFKSDVVLKAQVEQEPASGFTSTHREYQFNVAWDSDNENIGNQGFEDENVLITRTKKAAYAIRCAITDPTAGPDVTTESATEVTATGATLNASFDFEGWRGASETGFTWGYAADLSDGVEVAGDTLSGPFSAVLSSLTYNATIYYRAFAKDAIGNESQGEIESTCLMVCPNVTFDGHEYPTVAIGCQCWFAENLRSANYNTGDLIPSGLENTTWSSTTDGAVTVYDEDAASNLADYGRLYNWHAVNTGNLCPSGWHVPTDTEWTTLTAGLGGGAGAALKSAVSDTPEWDGTNSSGFSALAGGTRNLNGYFGNEGNFGYFWSSSPDGTKAWYRELGSGNAGVYRDTDTPRRGFSVRCVRDASTAPVVSTAETSSVTDTTATLNGSVEFNWSAMGSTGFKWGEQPDLSDGTVVAGDTLSGDFTASVTGLTLGTTYYFVAYATNAEGTAYGDTLSFVAQLTACGDLTSVSYQGYDYDIVSIGTQCWFAENLRNENYNNGSAIPSGLDWSSTTDGAVAVYNDGATYLADYGRLYNWYAVNTGNLCPSGWHVPTDDEWTTLTDGLGGDPGDALKASASDSPEWDGTNTSGFSALAGGYRDYDGPSYDVGDYGYFWSSSPDGTDAYDLVLGSGDAGVSLTSDDPRYGFSVRCVLDE